jgi:hypothetical protein
MAGGSSSALDWLGPLAGIGGSVFEGILGNQQANAQRQLTREQVEGEKKARDADRGLGATQLDPFVQQRSRQRQALLGALMQGFQPASYNSGKISGGVMGITPETLQSILGMFSQGANAHADQAFQHTAASASPNYMPPSMKGVGYGADVVAQLPSLLEGTNPFTVQNFKENNVRTMSPNARATGDTAMPRDPVLRRRINNLDPTRNFPV